MQRPSAKVSPHSSPETPSKTTSSKSRDVTQYEVPNTAMVDAKCEHVSSHIEILKKWHLAFHSLLNVCFMGWSIVELLRNHQGPKYPLGAWQNFPDICVGVSTICRKTSRKMSSPQRSTGAAITVRFCISMWTCEHVNISNETLQILNPRWCMFFFLACISIYIYYTLQYRSMYIVHTNPKSSRHIKTFMPRKMRGI